jgi:hypothetical protein
MMRMASPRWSVAASVLLLAAWSAGCSGDDGPSPNGAELTGIEHEDEVTSPFEVGMEAEDLGDGHFHLLVDTPCVESGEVIPEGDESLHLDEGETSAELDLEPGEHDLCLQVGDSEHRAMASSDGGELPDKTHQIEVTVKD